jgi:hypothetical protein
MPMNWTALQVKFSPNTDNSSGKQESNHHSKTAPDLFQKISDWNE